MGWARWLKERGTKKLPRYDGIQGNSCVLRKSRKDLWSPLVNIKVNELKSLLGVWKGRGLEDCRFGSIAT